MAADHRHSQPAEALQAPDGARNGLKGRLGGQGAAGSAYGLRSTDHGPGDHRHTLVVTVAANLCATPTVQSRRRPLPADALASAAKPAVCVVRLPANPRKGGAA